MRFTVIKQISTQASISANGSKGFKKDLCKEPQPVAECPMHGRQEWSLSGEATNNEREDEREKRKYQAPEINERSLINSPFQQYELSRTFSSLPALAETSLFPETTPLPASLPRRTVVTEAFEQWCDPMGLFFRTMVLVHRRWAGLGREAGGCEIGFKRLL